MKNNWCVKLEVATFLLLCALARLEARGETTAAGAKSPDIETSAAKAPADAAGKSKMMQFLEQDYMLGDWGGYRTSLAKRGIDFEFFYIASMPWNLSGGIRPGGAYEGVLLTTVDLDSEKLGFYKGGHLHAGSLYLHGNDHFSDKHIGDLNKVNLVDFPNSFRLWELWYEHKFLNNKVSLKLGQLAVDQDFIVAQYYNSLGSINFINQTFFYPTLAFNIYDIPGFPVGNHALPSTPYAAPGARLRVDPCESFYLQAAVYDGNPDFSSSGTRINLNQSEGALAYFEIGYRLNQRKGDKGLPGNYKVGAYFHTDDFVDNYTFLTTGTPAFHPNNYGAYFLADQYLFRENTEEDPAQQGLVGFFRVAGAPKDRNLTQFGIDGGLAYKGLIPTRDWDSLGVAASYLQLSDDIRRAQRDVNAVIPGAFPALVDYEAVIELTYKAQMTAWWTVQTSIQRPIHPGGSKAIRDSWAFVLLSTLRF